MLSGTCAELGQPLIMTGRVLFWPPWGEEAEEAREGRELEEGGKWGLTRRRSAGLANATLN